jgi:putative methyltransferase (TIGR04325 family)
MVRDGLARYERDSVLFDRIEYSFPLLATLLRCALENDGSLSVIDFGGALGSSYRECRPFLGSALQALHWTVIEQPSFVAAGRREMENSELRFHNDWSDASDDRRVDVVLFSNVLQYIAEPYLQLQQALALAPRYVVLDRLIVCSQSDERIHIQTVPPSIYSASYPVWVLSREQLLARMRGAYDLISEHDSIPFPDLALIDAEFKGFIFQLRTAQ